MWTRSELKQRGKSAFLRNYGITVLVTLILGFLTGELSGNSISNGARDVITENDGDIMALASYVWLLIFGIGLIIALIGVLVKIFIGNLIEIGAMRFYEENSSRKTSLGVILSGFRQGSYGKNVLTLFLRDLYRVLWTFLLIIPGIVKNYEYSMISYILAENPEISRRRAFEISREMMRGEKWSAFVLDLSFIGWNFLSVITFGIVGLLYSRPYLKSTWVELYKVNREKVLGNGSASIEELPGVDVDVVE